MREDRDFLLLIRSDYWWLSFHGAQTGKPTHLIVTGAFLSRQEDCTELCVSRGKCWTADEVRTKFGLDCNPFLHCFPAKTPYTAKLGTASMSLCLILLLYSRLVLTATLGSPPWRQLEGMLGVRIQELEWFSPCSTTTAHCDLVQVSPILVLSFPICKTFTCLSHHFFRGEAHWCWVSIYKHHNGTVHFQQVQAEAHASSRWLSTPQTKSWAMYQLCVFEDVSVTQVYRAYQFWRLLSK